MSCKYDAASWWKRWSGFQMVVLISMVALAPLSAQERTSPEQAQEPQPGLPLAPVVQSSAGSVQGLENHGVYEYLGIPYAQPPVGDLRWQPPQPYPQWTESREATHFGPTCAQITTLGAFAGPPNSNEDCLYLNVFAPKQAGSKNCRSWCGSMEAAISMARAMTTMRTNSSRRAIWLSLLSTTDSAC